MENDPQDMGAHSHRGVVAKKIAIVAVLAVAVGYVLWAKCPCRIAARDSGLGSSATAQAAAALPSVGALPRLVDLGAGKCIPCKMMAPILEELKKEYAGRLQVVFIDVWENPDAGRQYGINLIPTQIFFDASGKELFRHEGFFAKEDILEKWKEFGIDPQSR